MENPLMKHLIILGDGMADHPVERLNGQTLLEFAHTPNMDRVASMGRCGMLTTIPDGYQPGSEVANTAILGYDLDVVYEGRGPLEAASIGYEMQPGDLALRCNIITLADGMIINHHGGHLTTADSQSLIELLNSQLGSDRIRFVTGIQYRHLLVIRGGNKHIVCAPPHDHPNQSWRTLLVKPEPGFEDTAAALMTPQETADLLNSLILRSHEILSAHSLNIIRKSQALPLANSIWPWGGGYRPQMQTLSEMFPQAIGSGACISAVDLIRGIAHYAGLRNIIVDGATGLANTNYEGKAQAAIEALQTDDFVFLHIEASDEAGHDGDLQQKIQTIEDLDRRIVGPILSAMEQQAQPVSLAILPDHPTPVELRTHVAEPVPFAIYYKGITPDDVCRYDERSCAHGAYGMLKLSQFINIFMRNN